MPCFAFGAGTLGQLGDCRGSDAALPTAVVGAPGAAACVSVVCGANHALCLTSDDLYVWGTSHVPVEAMHLPLPPSAATGIGRAAAAAAAAHNQMVLAPMQQQQQQESASPPSTTHLMPHRVSLPAGVCVRRAAAGWEHTLLLTASGALLVVGDNTFGQLGQGQQVAATCQLMPLPLLPESGCTVLDVAAGLRHSLALLLWPNGQRGLVGWGANRRAQLAPAELLLPLDDGDSHDSCGGYNHDRGGSSADSCSAVVWQPALLPAAVAAAGDDVPAAIAAGGERSAALSRTGRHLMVWGRSPLPREQVTPVSAGVCAAVTAAGDGGGDQHGAPPAPTWLSRLALPALTADWARCAGTAAAAAAAPCDRLEWRAVCLGWRTVIALDAAGQVWAAGGGSSGGGSSGGGGGTTAASAGAATAAAAATLVPLPGPAAAIAAGSEHFAALLCDGRVFTWGWGEHGQLGHGAAVDVAAPAEVAAMPLVCGADGAQPQQQTHGACDSERSVVKMTRMPLVGVACGAGFTVVWG